MKLYCSKCQKSFDVKIGTFVKTVRPKCPYCGNNKYVVGQTEQTKLKSL